MSDKQTQLLEASIELFAENGFWNTPTSQIAKHAGVATGTLFNYFPTKEALIDGVFLKLKHEQSAYLQEGLSSDSDLKSCLEHIWYRYIDWAMENRTRYTLMQQLKLSELVSESAHQQQAEEYAFIVQLLKQAIDEQILIDVSPMYIGVVALSQMNGAVAYATMNNLQDMPLAKHITQAFEIFWRGIER